MYLHILATLRLYQHKALPGCQDTVAQTCRRAFRRLLEKKPQLSRVPVLESCMIAVALRKDFANCCIAGFLLHTDCYVLGARSCLHKHKYQAQPFEDRYHAVYKGCSIHDLIEVWAIQSMQYRGFQTSSLLVLYTPS